MSHTQASEISNANARFAGILYLVIAVFGAFSIGYVPAVIIQSGDGAATVQNILANMGLYRAGIFGDIVILFVEVILTTILFVMFKPFGQKLSIIALVSRAGMIFVMGMNLILSVMPIAMLTNLQPGADMAQLQSTIMTYFEAHNLGVFVWQLFFGLHLFALGWLVLRSQLVPGLLGWGLLIGSFGYTIQGIAKLLVIDLQIISVTYIGLLTIVTISEISFGLWLLFRGVKTPEARGWTLQAAS